VTRIHRGYLIAALVLVLAAIVVSLFLPALPQAYTLVAVAVAAVLGVFGFLANWKTIFGKPPRAEAPRMAGVGVSAQGDLSVGGDVVGRDKVEGDKVEGDKIVYEAPRPTIFALHQLPPPAPDFTGREAELAELRERFGEAGVAISGLHGLGGVGKTALALKLAAELEPRYPDAQFFVDLQGLSDKPLTPAEALGHLIRAYHPEARLPESEVELRGLYYSTLHGKRALLLLDNARDAAQVRPLLPPPAGCAVLVTSRTRFALPGLFAKDLDALPEADARELLLTIAPRLDAHKGLDYESTAHKGKRIRAAEKIGELCGYLPLALRLAGSALAERADLSPADYVRRLSDAGQRLKLTGADASLRLSYELLAPQQQTGWRALAVFPGDFDRTAAAAIWELEPDEAHDLLGELVRYSLVEYLTPRPPSLKGKGETLPLSASERGLGGEVGRYRLHDLARDYAGSILPETERAIGQQRHAAHYLDVLWAVDKLYMQGGENLRNGLALFDLERINIQAGQAWVAANADSDETAAQLCSNYPDAGVYVLNLRLHSREWIRWLEAALAAARGLKLREAEGVHLGNLGLAYAALGETRRAIEFYEQRLVIAREIGDRRGEGAVLGNLGLAYADLGESRRAIEFHEQALVILREIGDRRGEGNVLGNLGNAYVALGETRRAIEFHEQDLAIRREIGDRRGEGAALGNLGVAYADFGETRRAIEFYEQQSVITREIGDRRGEGNALWNLSLALEELGERGQAIARAEAALAIYVQIESPYAERVRRQVEEWQANQ